MYEEEDMEVLEKEDAKLGSGLITATRFDRNIKNFIAAIALAAAVIWWL